jgi:hypothetical protein
MKPLREYDTVRIVRLLNADRFFGGTASVRRPPRVGDVGIICHEYQPDDPDAVVAVEMVDPEGFTIWLADFARDELELVSRPERTHGDH